MGFFSEIVESILLTEGVPVGKVNDAIDRTYEVEINYRTDGKDEATGKRVIQPVAYGLTKAGNPVIRAFQPYGDTTSKIPSWKFFRLDRIIGWKPKFKQKFTEAPPGMHNADGNFNPNGDKTMSVVYNIAQFGNKKQRPNTQVADNGGPVEKDKLKKKHYSYKDNETIKKLDGLKKQLENPVYISDIIKKDADDKEIQKVGTGPVQKQNTTSQRHISYKDNDAIKKLDGIRKQLEQPTVYAPGYGKKQTQQVQTGPVQKQETASDKLSAIDKELSGDTKQPATSGPVQKTQQLYNVGDKVPQSVLDDWQKEQERRKQNKYGKRFK